MTGTPQPLSRGRNSDTFSVPPRPGEDFPVVIERSFGEWRMPSDLEWIELARRLPRPFQRVLDVARVGPEQLDVTLERFIGVDGYSILRALERSDRVLPLDVWLGLAVTWADALELVPRDTDGWRTPADPYALGVDVRGSLLVSLDEPNHVLGRWMTAKPPYVDIAILRIPQTVSPEHVKATRIEPASRVYSLGASLAALLQGRPVFDGSGSQIQMLVDIVTKDLAWSPERHPHCPPALTDVLRRATAREPAQRYADIPSFVAALRTAAGVEPASEARVVSVLLGAAPAEVHACFEQLARDASALPPAWTSGGLQVMQDRLLERAVPAEQLPLAAERAAFEAPEPPLPAPAPALEPEPIPPKRSGWRRFWPF